MTSEEKVQKLLSVTTRLCRLVKQENEMLSSNKRPEGLKELVSEKENLSNAYEQQIKLLDDEGCIKDVDPALRRRVKEAMATFGSLLEENAARLEAKISAGNHLFRIISTAARQHLADRGAYGKSGTMETGTRQAYRPGVSMGVSQDL
jgi:flagellar biosynthesis/type III secretory pathway chaperone